MKQGSVSLRRLRIALDAFGFVRSLLMRFDAQLHDFAYQKKEWEQSKDLNHSFERELGFLVAHGLLHTLGYDHQTDDEEQIMTQLQEEILQSVSLFR